MAANVQVLIEQGQRALQAGDREEARQFLIRATELDEENQDAWLWLASAVETEDDQRVCLDNVLVLNPENEQAQQMLAELDRNSGAVDNFDSLAAVASTLGTEDENEAEEENEADALDVGPFSTTTFAAVEEDDSEAAEASSFEDAFQIGEQTGAFSFSSEVDAGEVDEADEAVEGTPDDYDDDLGGGDYADEVDDGVGFGASVYEAEENAGFGELADEMDDDEVDYLAMLSDDVKPTRVPGTDMAQASGGMVGVIALGVLNAVAVGLLLFQLLA